MFSRQKKIAFTLCISIMAPAWLGVSASEAIPSVIMPLALSAQINDVSASQGVVVGVGERGIILRRSDAEGAWRQVPSPVSTLLNAVHLIGKDGWAVGHDAVILRTKDGGLTWRIVHRHPDLNKPFLDVFFLNEREGFAVGAFGLFLRSVDGGGTWGPVDVEEFQDLPPHLNTLRQLNDGSLLLVGEMGMFAHSTDGTQWRVGNVGYDGSLFTIVPAGQHGAVVAGMRGSTFFAVEPIDGAWESVDLGTTKSVFGGQSGPSGEVLLAAGRDVFELRRREGKIHVNHLDLDVDGTTDESSTLTGLLMHGGRIFASTYSGVRDYNWP